MSPLAILGARQQPLLGNLGEKEATVEALRSQAMSPVSGENSTEDLEFAFRDVSHYFLSSDNTPFLAVRDVSLEFPRRHFVTIIGPSGCGKSTLLNMAAGLFQPTVGEVLHRGSRIEEVNHTVGYMPQHDLLLPWRTVEGNVGIALEIKGVPRKERRERVHRILETVGLSGFKDSYPSQLSGGMRKRTALARVLIYEPDTLLMDEPFSALDAQLRVIMQRELLELWQEQRKSVLFVTHDLEEAILLADTVVVFGRSPGTVIHVEHLDLPRPRDLAKLRSTPEFSAVWTRLWKLLEGQFDDESEVLS